MSKNLKLKKVNKSFVPEPISCFSDSYVYVFILSYLLTPPLRQDMTQGQFLSGV